MPASGPYGKWTKADLADELNIKNGYLTQVMLEKGCPKLEPDLIAGRLYLYDDSTAERWLVAYRKWRDEEPARKAALRRELNARRAAEVEADLKRMAVDQKLVATGQEAQAQAEADRAAFAAAASKG